MVTIFNRKLLYKSTSQNEIDRVKKTLYKNAIEFAERTRLAKSDILKCIYVLRRDWVTAISLTNVGAKSKEKRIIWAKKRRYPV